MAKLIFSRTELQQHLWDELTKFGYAVNEAELNHIAHITMKFLKSFVPVDKQEREGELQ